MNALSDLLPPSETGEAVPADPGAVPDQAQREDRICQQLLARGRLKETDFTRARRLHEESGGSLISLMTRIGLVDQPL